MVQAEAWASLAVSSRPRRSLGLLVRAHVRMLARDYRGAAADLEVCAHEPHYGSAGPSLLLGSAARATLWFCWAEFIAWLSCPFTDCVL